MSKINSFSQILQRRYEQFGHEKLKKENIMGKYKCPHCKCEFENEDMDTDQTNISCPICWSFMDTNDAAIKQFAKQSDETILTPQNLLDTKHTDGNEFISFLEKYRGIVMGSFRNDFDRHSLIIGSVLYDYYTKPECSDLHDYYIKSECSETPILIKITRSRSIRFEYDKATQERENITVWKNGEWIHHGPWVQVIEKQIQDMIDALQAHVDADKKRVEQERIQKELKEQELLAKFIKGWS